MTALLKLRRFGALATLLLLGACATTPTDYLHEAPPGWSEQLAAISMIEDWELRGRLNVRQERANDTVNITWEQHGNDQQRRFDIRLSGTLGLGATAVRGDDNGIIVEKSGEEPVYLADIEELSRVYLEFDFPAANLLYWVRGIPVPSLPAIATWTPAAHLATLEQTDRDGRRWVLTFDRYNTNQSPAFPGRIRLEQANLRLTFLVSDWRLNPTPAP